MSVVKAQPLGAPHLYPPPRLALNGKREAPLRWTSHAITDIGKERKLNEDCFLCRGEAGIWVVADGMGGHVGGNIASRIVTDVLRALPEKRSLVQLLDEVESRIGQAHAYLRRVALGYNKCLIGTTLLVLLLQQGHGVFLWVGDSRLYRFRNKRLCQMTLDHSTVYEYVSAGLLSPEEARRHPLRNRILRAVGGPGELHLDLDMITLRPGDRYLLCTDGFTNEVSDAEIFDLLAAGEATRPTCEKLMQKALAGRAQDNITAIIVDLHGDDRVQARKNSGTISGA